MEELANQASLADGQVEIGHEAMYIETAELRALLRIGRLAEVRGAEVKAWRENENRGSTGWGRQGTIEGAIAATDAGEREWSKG